MASAAPSEKPGGSRDRLRCAEHRLFDALGVEARELWLTLERPRMRVRVLEIGEGPPVVHVHGGGSLGSVHAPLAAALPGRRHLLIDRPGFGLSDHVPVHPEFRRRSIEFLIAALDALGLESVDVVANSIGSAMSLWLALEQPSRVRSLGFAGAVAMLPGEGVPLVLQLLATPVLGPFIMSLERPTPRQVRAFLTRFGHDPDTVDPLIHEVILAAERVPNYAVAWRELLRATISVRGQRPGLQLTDDELRRIRCPVAFAWGSRDPMVGEQTGRSAAAALPNATFTVAGIGHGPWLDDPDAVARALEPVLV